MPQTFYSTRESLGVRGHHNGKKKRWQFVNGVLAVPDAEMESFEATLKTLPPQARSLIKTVSPAVAAQVVQRFKAQKGPAAAHGTTTANAGPQVQAAQATTFEQQAQALGMTLEQRNAPHDPSNPLAGLLDNGAGLLPAGMPTPVPGDTHEVETVKNPKQAFNFGNNGNNGS